MLKKKGYFIKKAYLLKKIWLFKVKQLLLILAKLSKYIVLRKQMPKILLYNLLSTNNDT